MKKHLFTTLLVMFGVMLHAQSPYISKVWEFCPAPGQFVNTLPEYEEGDDENDMRLKAEECIAEHNQVMISLGGYGGHVTFGFDHMIENVPDQYDFKILGNAFYANSNPNDTAVGGSAEPGVVMVSYDANDNGKPDDQWYELAGSEYYASTTRHNYTLTYYRPTDDHVATPNNDYAYLNDTTYIAWHSSEGEQGYLYKNTFHSQDYYPDWIESDSLSFTGTIMRNNAVDESGNGSYVLYQFAWGYADNQPNTTPQGYNIEHPSEFKIDWAVDSEGNPVQLPGIHFVKVYTGVNQYAGWLGETSTEILDAWDLHLLDNSALPTTTITETNWENALLLDCVGHYLGRYNPNRLYPNGIYILRATNGQTKKIIITDRY